MSQMISEKDLLAKIVELDILTESDNYLPIYHIRDFYPQHFSKDINQLLCELENKGKIALSALDAPGQFTEDQIDAGIFLNYSGITLFFVFVIKQDGEDNNEKTDSD